MYSALVEFLRLTRCFACGEKCGLVRVEVQTRNRPRDYILLNLNQIGVGGSHAERSENVASARHYRERSRPDMIVRQSTVLNFHRRQSAHDGLPPGNLLLTAVDLAKPLLDGRCPGI